MMNKRHTTVILSDEAWVAICEMAAIEEKSVSDLCTYLLEEYIGFDERVIYQFIRPNRSPHSIYLSFSIWPQIKVLKASQRRSISDILEQLIRAYTGLELGERVI